MYNGGISNFLPLLLIENRVDVAQNLQVLSEEVCSANIGKFSYSDYIFYCLGCVPLYTSSLLPWYKDL